MGGGYLYCWVCFWCYKHLLSSRETCQKSVTEISFGKNLPTWVAEMSLSVSEHLPLVACSALVGVVTIYLVWKGQVARFWFWFRSITKDEFRDFFRNDVPPVCQIAAVAGALYGGSKFVTVIEVFKDTLDKYLKLVEDGLMKVDELAKLLLALLVAKDVKNKNGDGSVGSKGCEEQKGQ